MKTRISPRAIPPFASTKGLMALGVINCTVRAMYDWEALQHTNPNLATDEEAWDFYMAYMGGPL
jgi:hypothetical protein